MADPATAPMLTPREVAHAQESYYEDCPGPLPQASGHSQSCDRLTAAIAARDVEHGELLREAKEILAYACALDEEEAQEGRERGRAFLWPQPKEPTCPACDGTGVEGGVVFGDPCKTCGGSGKP